MRLVMYLKYFELDLPYVINNEKIKVMVDERNIDFYDASKSDYELNWAGKRRSFTLETRCITAMFERLFNKFKTEKIRKILVECVENIADERIINYSGIATVQVKFDLLYFNSANETTKRKITLKLLMKGIARICEHENWDCTPFRAVSNIIEESSYINEWIWKKTIKSPNKIFKAKVICHHFVETMDIFISIIQQDGKELLLEKVITELPHEFAYAKHLGELRWISNFEVALINNKGDGMVSVTIHSIS
ncbi:hypothetical protein [Paenibacillus paridis]|uniref:hypothetical protein n=1 Tax=Paenibacillus paridis TaxID=2583376 RepID=UPI001120315B|nr:hypothetical protein [Paenibacillus paridis]